MADELATRIAEVLGGTSDGDIKRAYAAISARYRSSPGGGIPPLTAGQAAAYAFVRSPATHAAIREVMKRIGLAAPGFAPQTLLDIGGGIGTATWAAAESFPSLESASLLEHAPEMAKLGRSVAEGASSPVLRNAEWILGDFGAAEGSFDMTIASYVLGEITSSRRAAAVADWWKRSEVLVLIEPGTPAGYERINDAREVLRQTGASFIAPCPHEDRCPMAGRDWCHFSIRLQRTRSHRTAKEGALGFEDEKFSYVVASKDHQRRADIGGRIVRHPMTRTGHKTFEVCSYTGEIEKQTVSRRHGEIYKAARDLGWGDEMVAAPRPPPADS